MMPQWAHFHDETANHQLPIVAAFWIIQMVPKGNYSKIWCRFVAPFTQSFWMQKPHSTHAHSTASTTPHWLVQWSHHCSCMCIPVHSLWLPGYINVVQTILVILTMAGLFPNIPHIISNTWSILHSFLTQVLSILYAPEVFHSLR